MKESERTSRQLRGQGERAMAQQALNFQEAHNDNFRGPAVGDANWLMFDHKRGYAPDIESSGIADIFRLPKFATYFYQSQYGPEGDRNGFGKPLVFIANYWQAASPNQIVVYSNCDEVELQLNGKTVARQQPDATPFSDHLAHPPFTFAVPAYAPGTLRTVAYRAGKPAATTERRTSGAAYYLQLTYDRSGRDAGTQDVVFMYVSMVDASGTVLPRGHSGRQIRGGRRCGINWRQTRAGRSRHCPGLAENRSRQRLRAGNGHGRWPTCCHAETGDSLAAAPPIRPPQMDLPIEARTILT